MKTIALIHPKIDFEENYPCNWLPFSVLSIGSALPKGRFQVRIFDEHCVSAEQICQSLADDDLFIIGISIMTGGGQIKNGLHIAQLLRQAHPSAVTVFGGPHANVLPSQTAMCELVDYVLSGPGQSVFPQLADALDRQLPLDNIPGLYYRINGRIAVPTQAQACITHLSHYRFELIDPQPYIRYDATISDRTLNYIASQGCPYGCQFCYECVYGRKYYCMCPDYVQEDLRIYAEQFQVSGVKFYDADFFINRESCNEIIAQLRNYHLAWAASIHPNDILRSQKGSHNSLLSAISESRCTRLLMGMESGSNRILNEVIHKHTKAEDYLLIAKAIADYGILGSYTFMVGFPGETRAEYEETFALVRKLWELNVPLETKIHIYLPYPGTPLFEQAIALGHKPPDQLEGWSDYNYYKAMTPWTDAALENDLAAYTRMIDKNGGNSP